MLGIELLPPLSSNILNNKEDGYGPHIIVIGSTDEDTEGRKTHPLLKSTLFY